MQSPKGYILYKIYYDNHLVYLGRTKQPLINRIKTHCFKDPTVRSIEIDKISKIEYCILPTEADMFIYEIYYINIYKPPLNVDDKAKDNFTFGSLPEVEWLEWDYEDTLKNWSEQMGTHDNQLMFRKKEKKARRDYTKLMKERFQNGEISEEEYTDFIEKMRKERKQ